MSLIGMGLAFLLVLGVVWFFGGFLLYGGSYVPSFIREEMEKRRESGYRKQRAAEKAWDRETYGPPSKRFLMWLKDSWKYFLLVPAAIVSALLLSYIVAYFFWTTYC